MSKKLYYETKQMDDLKCPNCGGDNVHIDEVICWTRPTGEDGDVKILYVTSTGWVSKAEEIDTGTKNPSSRRQAFSLRGNCEDSGCHFMLHFGQHKGVTNMSYTLKYVEEK